DFLMDVVGVGQYQILRIHTWLDPYQDTTASSYQVTQAFKAIGSGGVFGKGLGVSEVYVPVRESDMIFATIAENFGFVDGLMIVFHVLENVGMNIGLLPVTGIPLPFVSQGGSALLGNMMGVGLIMSMRFHHRSYMFSGEGESFHSGAK